MILYLSRNLLISNKKKVGKLVRDNLLQENIENSKIQNALID